MGVAFRDDDGGGLEEEGDDGGLYHDGSLGASADVDVVGVGRYTSISLTYESCYTFLNVTHATCGCV